MIRNECLICGDKNIKKILDLGNHAYADTFISEDRITDPLDVYNLSCALCFNCGHVQTISKTNDKDRYSLHDYSYTSSNSSFSRKHWKNFFKTVSEKLDIKKTHFIVEIGSNDGFLLKQFKENGNKVLGIDASQYIADLATQDGIETIVEIFNEETSKKLLSKFEECDLVIANNVLNHSEQPTSFLRGVRNFLKTNGIFVYEVPYWKSSIESKKIDQVYHEHVSYFTMRSSFKFLQENGFSIIDAEVVDYHGGSLRVYAKKIDNPQEQDNFENLQQMIKEENFLFQEETYNNLYKELIEKKDKILRKIYKIREKKIPLVAVGAAAKGNTLLNFLSINSTIFEFVTDSSIHKQGKYTPLSSLKVVDDSVLAQFKSVYVLILSWNLSKILKTKLRKINKNIKFLEF